MKGAAVVGGSRWLEWCRPEVKAGQRGVAARSNGEERRSQEEEKNGEGEEEREIGGVVAVGWKLQRCWEVVVVAGTGSEKG